MSYFGQHSDLHHVLTNKIIIKLAYCANCYRDCWDTVDLAVFLKHFVHNGVYINFESFETILMY